LKLKVDLSTGKSKEFIRMIVHTAQMKLDYTGIAWSMWRIP